MTEQPGQNGAKVDWFYRVKLRKPVKAYNTEITEIKLRQPTGRDYLMYGNPLIVSNDNAGVHISWDPNRVIPLLAQLASVPDSTIVDLDIRDIVSLQQGIASFFLPEPGEEGGG